ncbi:hypothetical protein [Chelativorans sp.]|uniref:hypothetical protein n=1 Tax=Chelativorans sp. TaxID=2203393 RepID=UPI002810DF63|nr:hypothetical protein [Chelativorans sp.]
MATTPYPSGPSQQSASDPSIQDSAREAAESFSSAARRQAGDQIDSARRKTSETVGAFAEAVRKAGDELAAKDEGPAAQLLSQAAGGLEQLSTAISQKRLEDIVGDVRRFGREHPGAFMMGSVLVGIALGRFAQSAMPATSSSSHPEPAGNQPTYPEPAESPPTYPEPASRPAAPFSPQPNFSQTPGGTDEL